MWIHLFDKEYFVFANWCGGHRLGDPSAVLEFFWQFAMEEMPRRNAKMFFGDEQLAELAILAVRTADECGQATALAFAEKVFEQLCRFLASPVFKTTESRHVDGVKVQRFPQIERCKVFVCYLSAGNLVFNAEPVAVEVPCEIFLPVDVEPKDAVRVQLFQYDVGCVVLTTGGDENHGRGSRSVSSPNGKGLEDQPLASSG